MKLDNEIREKQKEKQKHFSSCFGKQLTPIMLISGGMEVKREHQTNSRMRNKIVVYTFSQNMNLPSKVHIQIGRNKKI